MLLLEMLILDVFLLLFLLVLVLVKKTVVFEESEAVLVQ